MKIAEYKIIDYKTEEITVPAEYDNDGNIVTEGHIQEIQKPIYALTYRDMTEQEITEMQAQEIPQELPTAEERIEILEQAFMEFVSEVLEND